jgi:hypothetical protein
MPFMPVRSVATGTAAALKNDLPIIPQPEHLQVKLPQYPAPCGQIQRSNPVAVTRPAMRRIPELKLPAFSVRILRPKLLAAPAVRS